MTSKVARKSRRTLTKAELKARAAKRLDAIFHPRWSSRDDHQLVTLRSKGIPFDHIAVGLKRDRRAVEQRWHRLRVIPRIDKLLEDYGLTSRAYALDAGVK
ncbi:MULTISPECIES: hypothetical protein [Phaeobacter]|uniref:hypothetical protein n=1 Tax=Phaeobacter TaxID=302485 RepID=UPI00058EB336|nr:MULTISPECIES: hypothetical protein [Phaeobacter]AUQ89379.1 hypothetical protein PhaeoP24_00733 [Phaeobacter inhibens]KII12601.1 hypothetical protein OO25_17100 [Phaeobacter sp. S60]